MFKPILKAMLRRCFHVLFCYILGLCTKKRGGFKKKKKKTSTALTHFRSIKDVSKVPIPKYYLVVALFTCWCPLLITFEINFDQDQTRLFDTLRGFLKIP